MTPADYALLDRRRAILAALAVAPTYTLPAHLLREQIALIGYPISRDRMATDLAWLAEQDFVIRQEDAARLTDRGLDVVLGRAEAPGVRRPTPGEIT